MACCSPASAWVRSPEPCSSPRTGEDLARRTGCERKRPLRGSRARAGPRAQRRSVGRGDARDRGGLDLDSFRAAGLSPDDVTSVGAGARTGCVCGRVHGWDGAGQHLMGQVATRIGIPAALTTAATGMLLAIALTWRFKLGHHQVLDFRPAMDWPIPVPAETPEPDVPVMVTINYRIQPDKRAEFVAAMQPVREMPRRNG